MLVQTGRLGGGSEMMVYTLVPDPGLRLAGVVRFSIARQLRVAIEVWARRLCPTS